MDLATNLEAVYVVVTLSDLSPTNVTNTLDRLRDMGIVNKNRVDYDRVVLLCSSTGRPLPTMRGTISNNKVQEIIKMSKFKYKEHMSGPKNFAFAKRKQENDNGK
jgi:DNA-binding transcriptional ArsR family regulator